MSALRRADSVVMSTARYCKQHRARQGLNSRSYLLGCLPAFMLPRRWARLSPQLQRQTQLDDRRTSPGAKGECPVRFDTPITWKEEIQW